MSTIKDAHHCKDITVGENAIIEKRMINIICTVKCKCFLTYRQDDFTHNQKKRA